MNRLRTMTVGGALLVALVLAVFAYMLADAQRQEREDVEQRFRDVAAVSAAVTDGIFEAALAGTVRDATTQLAARDLERAQLEALARAGRLVYATVLDRRGRRIVATAQAPPPAARTDAVEQAVETGEARLSDVVVRGPQGVVEWAIPYPAEPGRRIHVRAIPSSAFAEFLAGALGRLPNFADAETVMIDSNAVVLGGARLTTPVGTRHEDGDLIAAMAERDHGDYGDSRYFATGEIGGSPFRIVLSTTDEMLYESIGGARQTVPWIIFAAFALVSLGGLYLLRRAVLASAEIQRRELSEQHAVEINDNIIQGLALAKYQLQAGEQAASASQVSETLREAQRLVSGLLGEAEVKAGQLRREVAAETRRPDPAPDEEREP